MPSCCVQQSRYFVRNKRGILTRKIKMNILILVTAWSLILYRDGDRMVTKGEYHANKIVCRTE